MEKRKKTFVLLEKSEMNPNSVRPLLNEIFYLASRSPILVHQKVQKFIENYQNSDQKSKLKMLENIAKEFHPEEKDFRSKVKTKRTKIEKENFSFRSSKKLRRKKILFNFVDEFKRWPNRNISNFSVWSADKRTASVLWFIFAPIFSIFFHKQVSARSFIRIQCFSSMDFPAESADHVKRMDDVLQELLATWFSTGLLQVERITWQSPCEIGQFEKKTFNDVQTIFRFQFSSTNIGIRSCTSDSNVDRP